MREHSPPQDDGSTDIESPLDRPAPTSGRLGWAGAALLLHAAVLAGAALSPGAKRPPPERRAALVSRMFEVQLEAPKPEPEPQPEVDPEPAPPPSPVRKRKNRPSPPVAPEAAEPPAPTPPEPPPEAPAPEAAEAAEVLTAEPDAPVDFGDTIVSGAADAPVGGASAAAGTADQPVRDARARADGVTEGTGEGRAPPVDRSRPPGLAGGARWDCPFPREADFAGVDQASVVLGVKVNRDGELQSVRIHDDPGHGFGREARRCALRKRWHPALDAHGRPIASTVHVRVRFHR